MIHNAGSELLCIVKVGIEVKIRNLRGFTLIELLIVMVILGLLASLVAPQMFSKVESSRKGTAKAQMTMLSTSLDAYRLDMGTYPENLTLLVSSSDAGWDGPYLPRDVPLDPWNHPYIYRFPGQVHAYDMVSYGADGKEGGEGDNADISYR